MASKGQKKALIERLRDACLLRGVNGINGFARAFKIFDNSQDRKLDKQELKNALNDYGVECAPEELDQLFQQFDSDSSGSISFDEFLKALRPPMNKCRVDMVMKAFKKMDYNQNGTITDVDLQCHYKLTNHPKFLSGEWNEKKCYEEFLKVFDTPNQSDGKVTAEEFLNYYSGVSSSIDNDAYFNLMMTNSWKLEDKELRK